MTPATATPFEMAIANLHRSLAGLCVALLLAGGLVSVPTSCDCGAGVAHGHSLFVLSGHHHGSENVVWGRQDDDHDHHQHMQEAPAIEPQLMGRINHASDRVAISMPAGVISSSTWQRVKHRPLTDHPGSGHIVSPDIPPPRRIDLA
jgi:hypothetical protein